jgi:hypothetical protein
MGGLATFPEPSLRSWSACSVGPVAGMAWRRRPTGGTGGAPAGRRTEAGEGRGMRGRPSADVGEAAGVVNRREGAAESGSPRRASTAGGNGADGLREREKRREKENGSDGRRVEENPGEARRPFIAGSALGKGGTAPAVALAAAPVRKKARLSR